MMESKHLTQKYSNWRNVFAVDPGTTASGFAEFRDGVLERTGKMSNIDLRAQIAAAARAGLIDVLIIEGMRNPRADEMTFKTCYEIGRFIERTEALGVSTVMVYRHEIKKHWLGTNQGGDKEIREALVEHYGGWVKVPTKTKNARNPFRNEPPEALKDVKADAWSALAIGLYAYRRHIL